MNIDNLKKLVSNYNKEYLKQKKSINQEKENKEILNNNLENIKDETEDYLVQSSLDKYIKFLKYQLYIKLMSIDPYVFEEFIKDFFNKLGYENVEKTKSSSDGGVDLLIYRDKFNFDPIIVQIKRYNKDNKISISQLREFSTVIEQQKSRYGLFLTTSDFSPNENKRNDLITQNKQIQYWNFDNIFSLMYKNKIAFKVKWPDSFIEVLELDTQYFDKYIIET